MRALLLLALCGLSGCAAARRATIVGEHPLVVPVARPGLIDGPLAVEPHDATLAGRAATAIRSRLPAGDAAGAARLRVVTESLQLYQRPMADGRRQRTCRVTLALHGPGLVLRRSAARTEHVAAGPEGLEHWGERTARALANRAARALAEDLLPQDRRRKLVFLDDGSAPVGRGIEQAAGGDLDGAATSFAAAARNALEHRDVALYDLGLVHEARGRLRDALAAYEQAWRLSGEERYLGAMGRVRRRQRSREEGRDG